MSLTIGLGYSNLYSRTSMNARIINNKFWNLNFDGEAISVKTSDNLIEGNQLTSSEGGFTQRYGRNKQRLRSRLEGTDTRLKKAAARGCHSLPGRLRHHSPDRH